MTSQLLSWQQNNVHRHLANILNVLTRVIKKGDLIPSLIRQYFIIYEDVLLIKRFVVVECKAQHNKMATLSIKGYEVGFPYETPYPLQQVYMEKVLTCLDEVNILHFSEKVLQLTFYCS